jgi:RNA polymerase sigma factor (TIGR02999 family)
MEVTRGNETKDVTALLAAVRRGDRDAFAQLFAEAYDKLREISRSQRRCQPNADTLTTTALVHEAFIKLFGSGACDFNDRAHFLAVAATAMRQIIIGHARRNSAAKRGGGEVRTSFEEVERALAAQAGFETPKVEALLALDRALENLRDQSPRQCRIVECRFYAGMSIEETAAALGISTATVKRDWSMAKAWLHREIQKDLK